MLAVSFRLGSQLGTVGWDRRSHGTDFEIPYTSCPILYTIYLVLSTIYYI